MGRSPKTRTLGVWMNGERVGTWTLPASGQQEFAYAQEWLESPRARALSLSLPLRRAGEPYRSEAAAYFENLLPDNPAIRARMQRRFRTESDRAFDLLAEAGRDCVGAVQLFPGDAEPPRPRAIDAVKVTPAGIARLLESTFLLGGGEIDDDTFRISLAGAQEKTALLRQDGQWHIPKGATPTTHIFKLPIGQLQQGIDLSTSIENEWLCAQIVQGFGLPVADCKVQLFGQFQTLVVERFDRKPSADGKRWLRLPQEDFCQATSTPPGLKYENDGGPGIVKIMQLLLGSESAETDRRQFMKSQLVFWLMAAIDGHAKNFSIFLQPGSAYRLTPLYDILSAHPLIGHGRGRLSAQKIRMAMAVLGKNRHYHWSGVRLRHWQETARRCGFPDMDVLAREVLDMVPTALDSARQKVPNGFPAHIADSIFAGIASAAKELSDEVAAR